MDLEQLYVFPINSPLTIAKRQSIEKIIAEKAQENEKDVTYKWLKRGDEKLLRAFVDPVTIEVVFHDDRVELFGAAPSWAKLMFTKARKAEIKDWIEQALIDVEFLKTPEAQAQAQA